LASLSLLVTWPNNFRLHLDCSEIFTGTNGLLYSVFYFFIGYMIFEGGAKPSSEASHF
jgi:hypothetical protein